VSLPRTSPFTERRRYTPLIPIKWSQRCTRARSIRYSGHYAPDLSLSNRLSNGVRSCEVGSHSTFRLHIRTIIGVIIDFSISFLFLETLPDLPPFIVSPDRCRHSHVYFGLLIFSNTGPTFFLGPPYQWTLLGNDVFFCAIDLLLWRGGAIPGILCKQIHLTSSVRTDLDLFAVYRISKALLRPLSSTIRMCKFLKLTQVALGTST